MESFVGVVTDGFTLEGIVPGRCPSIALVIPLEDVALGPGYPRGRALARVSPPANLILVHVCPCPLLVGCAHAAD